ncbi:MAG: outer membrane lipoprotein carrier protein LolA [Paracoccaceae bacterium]
MILAPVLALLMALPAQAEKLSLDEISSYINGLTTAEAPFTQINWDGSTSSGHIYIRRPGRMRFEYAPPEATLVLASGGQVAVFDGKSNQPPEQYPLKRTPLNLILERKVDLSRAKMVVGHTEDGPLTIVTAQDPDHPELGTIQLAFTANPVMLRQWTVTDETGGQTRVLLEPLVTGQSYEPSLFSIHAEIGRQSKRRQ